MGERRANSEKVSVEEVRGFFNEEKTVDHYMRAVANVGLWESEKRVFQERFPERKSRILDLGCGAGRIAFGLSELGYRNLVAVDLAEEMVKRAEEIGRALGAAIDFRREDGTRLSFPSESFDGIIFGFNGLMQIPDWTARREALGEISRCLKRGGVFVFTTLDREDEFYRKVFAQDSVYEQDIDKNPSLVDYGDRLFRTSHGTTYMHVPSETEVRTALENAGFSVLETRMRSEIAKEPEAVLDFSEDCRFWVAKKP